MFNPLPLSRSASHEPSSPSHAARESAAAGVGGALKRSSSDSDAGRVAVAAAAAAAAASASAVSATAAYVAATSEAAGQSKEHEQQQQQQQQQHHKSGSNETLAARDFYPSSLLAAAAAVPAAMAAAAAMCFPADHHVASSGPPAVAAAGFTLASNDAALAPRPAEPGAASASSIVETQPQTVIAARAHCSRRIPQTSRCLMFRPLLLLQTQSKATVLFCLTLPRKMCHSAGRSRLQLPRWDYTIASRHLPLRRTARACIRLLRIPLNTRHGGLF
jgi:hypothetical protein